MLLPIIGEKPQENSIVEIPNHIQAVERNIQIVSQVSQSAATKERREGIILNKIQSRNIRPKFESRKDFS